MNYLFLFLAVVVGYLIAVLVKNRNLNLLSIFLAFSGSFLLSVTIFELLPEVYEVPSKNIGVYIILGILFQIILEFFSKGAEHGHVHIHSEKTTFSLVVIYKFEYSCFVRRISYFRRKQFVSRCDHTQDPHCIDLISFLHQG